MLINTTYFVGEILIPNLTGNNPLVAGNVEEVNRFIKIYEKEYLLHVLGQELYDAFIAGIEGEQPEEKWINLRSHLLDSSVPYSPIAGYVYYHFKRNQLTNTTALGESESAAENSITALNTYKMAQAYNQAVRDGVLCRSWLAENIATYPEFDSAGSYQLSTVNIFGV